MTEEQLPYHQQRALRKAGILPPLPTRKEKKPLAKVSKKKLLEDKAIKDAGGDDSLDHWFEERRLEMTGKCALCGGKTEKKNDETYRRSIHHLFDKRPNMFPSVALNENNWLEVCHFGNSCHDNIHNRTITWELLMDSAEREMILEKARKILPFIASAEMKNFPEIILKELMK